MRLFGRRRKLQQIHEIAPDEVFLDSSNLPGLNATQFEGRVERPLSSRSIAMVGIVFIILSAVFGGRAYFLQVTHGARYAEISKNNTLRRSVIFATRGVIYDRTGFELAWNTPQESEIHSTPSTLSTSSGQVDSSPEGRGSSRAGQAATSSPYALRAYTSLPGLSHLIGYVKYPKADAKGNWWQEEYIGVSGTEFVFDSILAGENGSSQVETDAHGRVERKNIVTPPRDGDELRLSINADIQSKLYTTLWAHAQKHNFQGGAAVIMDVHTGEVIALTSFPEYDHTAFTNGDRSIIQKQSTSVSKPLLNRAVSGLYAPGSIIKPIFAAAALNEKIISPDKQINSVGKITIPNPYDPDKPSIYRDWTVHGWVDMRTAIAVSSDEYFYTIGGGYGGQQGLGIARLDSYAKLFGLGSTTGIALNGEQDGIIPTPEWKEQVFPGDPWRLGNTYHTAIGQYGFQVTPIQAVRFTAAIGNGGKLLTPHLIASSTPEYTDIGIPDEYLQIVREGMRLAVTSDRHDATAKSLYIGGIKIAGKTGTAQVGARNEWMNSWSVGFWPADHPRYAYAVVLERAPAGTAAGASPALQPFFYWLIANHPEYLE
ncbi:hypothetical protein FJY93_04935 [Candidatus Kaiserbacteria bacterium]|nr:hypothetical protein [Candidatus Kaiserbacteria bacterium]